MCVTWNEYTGPASSPLHEYKGEQIAHVLITSGDNICIKGTYLELNQGHTLDIQHKPDRNIIAAV